MPRFVSFLLLFFISATLHAQTWEVGAFAGGSAYMGDLNQYNPVKVSGIALGGFLKRNFNGYVSAKINYTYGQISGADNTSSNPQLRERNLSFTTQLNEVALIGEFNFFKYIPKVGENRWTPFIYLGIGGVGYNPQATYQGHTYDLRPLETEGESKPYANIAATFPYGVGVKYNIAGAWNLTADIGYRNPSTDYLDDVSGKYPNPASLQSDLARALSDRSGETTGNYIGTPGTQRGDLRPKDTYMFVGLSISFTFLTSKCYF